MNDDIDTLLVTGGLGYIGSRLIRDLGTSDRFSDVTIRILDNLHRENDDTLMDLPDSGRYEFLEGDIMDPTAVRRALDDVDAVIHLAALVKTPFSFDHPTWTEHVNHWGTARLVEQSFEADVDRFVFASSASVYGAGGPFTESDPCEPIGPYAQSKLQAEARVTAAAGRGLDSTVIRFGTVYGGPAPGIRFHAVPNRFVYLLGTRRPITVHGTGEQRRPFIHVEDASAAIRDVLDDPATVGEVYNAVEACPTIQEVAETLARSNKDGQVTYTEQNRMTEISIEVEADKLRDVGWEPNERIPEGLTELVNHFDAFQAPPQPGRGKQTPQELRR